MTDSPRYCRRCRTVHPRIAQAVPDKPLGYYRELVLDFIVIVMVFVSVLLWIGVAS